MTCGAGRLLRWFCYRDARYSCRNVGAAEVAFRGRQRDGPTQGCHVPQRAEDVLRSPQRPGVGGASRARDPVEGASLKGDTHGANRRASGQGGAAGTGGPVGAGGRCRGGAQRASGQWRCSARRCDYGRRSSYVCPNRSASSTEGEPPRPRWARVDDNVSVSAHHCNNVAHSLLRQEGECGRGPWECYNFPTNRELPKKTVH